MGVEGRIVSLSMGVANGCGLDNDECGGELYEGRQHQQAARHLVRRGQSSQREPG